jgi:hypothetical protein
MKPSIFYLAPLALACCLTAQDQKAALPTDSEEMTELLEKRWPLSAIVAYCTPGWRWNPLNQNLVPEGDRYWRGKLYNGKTAPFDEISWYAGVNRDKIEYSLNAKRGKDYWNLEIGNEKSLREPPKKASDFP